MKKKFIFLILFIMSLFFNVHSYGQNIKGKAKVDKKYKKEWKTVDSLDQRGLPKSALEVVEKIFKMAKDDKNDDQILKALIYRMKYITASEENSYDTVLFDIEREIDLSSLPNRHVLHSMMAELYWMYYQNNQYQILQRTNTVGYKSNDIKTWTLDQLIDKVIKHYLVSINEKDSLRKIDMKYYDEIISFGSDSRLLRPTLYDFLASRAYQFFASSELTLTRPADFFQLKEDFYFAPVADFVKSQVKSSDSLSLHYQAVVILKDWLTYRLNEKSIEALVDLDLARLSFVYNKSVNPNKNTLYLEALKNMQEQYAKSKEYSEIGYYIAFYYYNRSGNYNPEDELTLQFKKDKVTALEICNSCIEKYPDSYGAGMCKSLKNQIQAKNLTFKTESLLGTNTKFPINISYTNIDKVYAMVGSITLDALGKLSGKYYGEKYFEQLLKSVKVVKNYSFKLKGTDDYNMHRAEALIDGLPIGTYVVFLSDNEQFGYEKKVSDYAIITVTSISYIERSLKDGSVEYTVMDRNTGMPIKDVTVKATYQEYDYKLKAYKTIVYGTYLTDVDGRSVVETRKDKNSNTVSVKFIYGNDIYDTYSSNYLYYRDYQTAMNRRVFLFTDRGIYRPGQTVYYKGIILNSDGEKSEVAANQQETVYLYDVNYQKVGEQTLTTNEYGSFNGSFAIPKGLLNGQMQLYCYYGSVYFSVEEYKRPKFQVEMLPFKGNYVLNDSVKVSGKAVSYAGSAISDAKVKYRIVRKPIWRGWWYYYYPVAEYQMAEGNVFTNEKGEFNIKFIALPDLTREKSKYLFFEYDIAIDVTDLNGETQSTQKSMVVGSTALDLSLDLGENIVLEQAGKTTINTKNMNGEFLPAKGEVKIYKLKNLSIPLRERPWENPDEFIYTQDEWNSAFPGNVYKQENDIKKREKDKLILSKSFNTAESKELDLSEMKNWEAGVYVAESNSVDAFGNPVEWKNYFTLYALKNGQIPDKIIDWFVPVKSTAEVGEKAQFIIGSSLPDVKIIYEVEVRGQIESKKWIEPKGLQQLIEIPVKEEYKGNFSVHFVFIRNNRLYNHTVTVNVPRTDKMLDISFETFRDKLYPGQDEEWKIKIKGKKGEKVAAEMLATLYDASLDKFRANEWPFSIYNSYYAALGWKSAAFREEQAITVSKDLNPYISMPYRYYDYLNWFSFYFHSYNRYYDLDYAVKEEAKVEDVASGEVLTPKNGGKNKKSIPGNAPVRGNGDDEKVKGPVQKKLAEEENKEVGAVKPEKPKETNFSNVQVRTNFNETAFFYPVLQTNQEGEVIIKFKVPESLTTWRMMGFAHTKDLKYGTVGNELKTQKDLMVLPNDPRFFRQNDKIVFPVKISNVSKNVLKGTAHLELFDAITMKPVEGILEKRESADKNFEVSAEGNTVVKWALTIPDNIGAITYKVVAKSGNFSDGEQKPLPVLTNRMLVTESLPLPIRGKQTKDYQLDKLVNSKKSSTLKNFKLTLEYSSNPAWYAIQALPYVMEYPYECYEQTFSRLYANTIASYVANSNPKVKRVFDSWKETPGSEALLSNLEKNQELKSVLLEETPWVLNAANEQQRKRNIALLFDLNRMADELGRATTKLEKGQTSNGGWPWFDGMKESRYITQHIVNGFGHLDHLGIKTVREDSRMWNMLQKAVHYTDESIVEEYNWLKKYYKKEELLKNHLSYDAIYYLYGRSFFKDIEIPKRTKEAFDYFKGQSEKYWLDQDLYSKGMIALYLSRYETKTIPLDICKSVKEFSTSTEEMGMYWKNNVSGYYWYQAPIETQAIMIETFNEVSKSQPDVESLKVWLLKQKQTQDWRTTIATCEAIYALLLTGDNWLESDQLVKIKLGDQVVDPKTMDDVKIEAGTGYFKKAWNGDEIKPEMGKVHLEKTDAGIAWGGLYWQYFEDLDKITPHETPLKLNKKLFVERITSRGKAIEAIDKKTKLIVGDKVIVRIELRVDRAMEYVHMKDMRASGFEPINVFSQYKWQDGLGYYESTKDAATNFFMDYLPKGTFVFEYPLRVTHEGDFSNGVTTIQCMYAPEFTSHSEGVRVNVGE